MIKKLTCVLLIIIFTSCNSQTEKPEAKIIESILNTIYKAKKDKIPRIYFSIENDRFFYDSVLSNPEKFKSDFKNDSLLYNKIFNKETIKYLKGQYSKQDVSYDLLDLEKENIRFYDGSNKGKMVVNGRNIGLTKDKILKISNPIFTEDGNCSLVYISWLNDNNCIVLQYIEEEWVIVKYFWPYQFNNK